MPRSSASLASKRSSNNNSGQNGITAASKRQILSRSSSIVVTPSSNGASASHTNTESNTNLPKVNGGLQHRNSAPAGGNSILPNGYATGSDVKVNGKAQSGSTQSTENAKVKNPTESHKQIDIKPATSGTPDTNLDSATNKTILPSWPLADSLTLLIILLQLPSTLLSLVYFLFALLSIIPTNLTMLGAVSSSASNVSSFTSVFLYGYQGGPSVLTIIMSDLIMFCMSLFLWPSARSFLIDLAQAVVADSLGAGTSPSSTGTTKSMGACALVVGLSQIFKDRFRLASIFGIDLNQSSAGTAMVGGASNNAAAAEPGMIRWIFALHIVTQSLVKVTRKTLKNNKNITESSASNATATGTAATSSAATHAKTANASSTVPQRELDASLANQDNTKSKKSKKQNQWIRTQQPLWAALASMIVHLKEVEKTTATGKSDPKPREPSSLSDEPVVWITKIGATEIEFGSNYHLLSDQDVEDDSDKRFPFYVELNGIKWPQTAISKASEHGEGSSLFEDGHDENEWCAEIFGLTPTTEYDISFLRESTGEVIYMTSACTTSKQANIDSQIKEIVPKPTRPLSPLTTLLNSREASQNILEEQKRKLKTAKRANSRKIASLRSEIDTAKSRLGSGDKNDERARRRALSLRDSVRRAEEDVEKFTSDLQSLEALPEDPEDEYNERKREWKVEKDKLSEIKDSAVGAKEEADRKIIEVQNEVATAISKREKANTKMARLKNELERITADNTAAANEERKLRERDEVYKRRQKIESEFSTSINKMEIGMNDYRQRSALNWAQLRAIESSIALQQQQQVQSQQLPMNMDMNYPTNPSLNTTMSPRSIFGPPQTSPVYSNYPNAFGASTHAAQSSNLLSGSSILSNQISNAFPSSVLYNNRDRSATYSNDGQIASILHHSTSDPTAMTKTKPGFPESSSASYLSDPFMPSVFTQSNDENSLTNSHGNGHNFYGGHHHQGPMLHHYVNGEEEKSSQEGSGSSSSRSSG